ncbi:MAG: Ig-like domain-containing protein [Candidatus Limnocylindrales bacterium]
MAVAPLGEPFLKAGALVAAALLLTAASFGPGSAPATANQGQARAPLAAASLTRVGTNHRLRGPIRITFPLVMDQASVAAALDVKPRTAVRLTWSAKGRAISVAPAAFWKPGTFHTLTIGTQARDAGGRPIAAPVRATFQTRSATEVTLRATRVAPRADGSPRRATPSPGAPRRQTVLPETAIRLHFSRPVTIRSVRSAVTVRPGIDGSLEAVQAEGGAAQEFVWRPSKALEGNRTFALRVGSAVRDVEGGPLAGDTGIVLAVASRPAVKRHGPAAGARAVDREAAITIRFTEPMAREVTERAFSLTGRDARGTGSFAWSEKGRLLTWTPSRPLAKGKQYTVVLAGSARSADGIAVGPTETRPTLRFSFTTENPPPPPAPRTAANAEPRASYGDGGSDADPTEPPTGNGAGTDTSGGSGSGSGPDPTPTPEPAPTPQPRPAPQPTPAPEPTAPPVTGSGNTEVERYVLGLINCMRTGGRLETDGSCTGYGTGRYSAYVDPLSLHAGISVDVARPYAHLLASGGDCSHFMDGGPDDRLRRAGYTSYRWAENLGCRSGDAFAAVLGSHLFFQAEQPTNGGHWVNLKNPSYSTVGIGVSVVSGNVRVVTDFYDP